MILETKAFKQTCSKILAAIDNGTQYKSVTDNLELNVIDNTLYLNVTNTVYYVSAKFGIAQNEDFKATVNALLFLKLISQLTTDTVEMKLDPTNVIIKSNGKYRIPLIFEDNHLMELPTIIIENPTVNMVIPKSYLDGIANYNSREMFKDSITKPIQKMYYIDEEGCITFTATGACINNFNLSQPVKMLLDGKIVKLFKLFKSDDINFTLGYDQLENSNVIQTKVKFYDDEVELTAKISCDDTQLNSVPVKAIRSKLNINYPYSIVLDKNLLNQSLNRLLLFSKNDVNNIYNYFDFNFTPTELLISDKNNNNMEILGYQNGSTISSDYKATLNINELKTILDGCSDNYVSLLVGNKVAIVVVRNNIKNILMEYSQD